MPSRPDLFTTIHKGLRWWMARITADLGAVDIDDRHEREALVDDVLAYLDAVDEHTLHEETFIAPVLTQKEAGRAAAWHGEHETLEAMGDAVRRQAAALRAAGSGQHLAGLGLELYRAFARFSSAMLLHLDEEETRLMPLLWSVCSDEEIAGIIQAFRLQHGAEAAALYARLAPAFSPSERTRLGV